MSDARPFLKFVGGKTQLLPELRKHVPATFGRYFEPFVGGGAMFFDLASQGRLNGEAVLADMNPLLIKAYKSIRDHVDILLGWLKALERSYKACTTDAERRDCYLRIRSAIGYPCNWGPDENEAARLIAVNKTCFNGLFRVNKSGKFNVPFGRYTNPTICDEENLRAVSQALQGVEIWHSDFEPITFLVSKGDFVYFDPPYVPVSDTADFTSYTSCRFEMRDQVLLRDTALSLKRRGVHVVLSNADVPAVRELYKDFTIHAVKARRNINSKPGARGPVGEVIVT